jgi:uncharacterized protein YoxC
MLMTISVTVIAAIMVAAVLFLIPTLLQIRRTAHEVEKIIEAIRVQIAPLGHDLTITAQEINSILQSIHRQVDKVEDGITTVRDTVVRLREFEEGILRRFKPLLEVTTLVSALRRGIETFIRMVRR